MNKEAIMKQIEDRDIEFLRMLYVDNDGIIRGRVAHKKAIAHDLVAGHPYTVAMSFFSCLDRLVPESTFGCVGEHRAIPDLDTFRVAPYAPKTATVLCDLYTLDRKPAAVCGRTALKNVLKSIPYRVYASFENEFYFLREDGDGNLRPFDDSLCFATTGMNAALEIITEIADALTKQGMTVEKYYPEYGPGQQELIVRYDEVLKAADNQVYFRETVRAVAAKHGIIASFMPKPFQNLPGSSCHIHISLWDGNKNLFYDPNGECKVSELGLSFIAGVLAHLPAICAFTAATVTSYKRLLPHNWASCYACWGPDNREAAVRVCSSQYGREEETLNFEVKPVDAANNPYLAFGAVIAAGIDGIEHGLKPGAPVLDDPFNLGSAERQKRGIVRLPQTLYEAAQALRQDTLYKRAFGEILWNEYIQMKEFNWSEYNRQVTPWEIERFARIF